MGIAAIVAVNQPGISLGISSPKFELPSMADPHYIQRGRKEEMKGCRLQSDLS
jgi:hypothetical protein